VLRDFATGKRIADIRFRFVRSYTLRQLSLSSGEVFVLVFSQFLEKYRAGQTARVRRPCAIECRPPSAICYCRLRVTIVFSG
jgi:hypothetical protein